MHVYIHACVIDFVLFELHVLPSSSVSADIWPLSNAGVPTSVADAVASARGRRSPVRPPTAPSPDERLVDRHDGALMTNFTMGGLGLSKNNVIDREPSISHGYHYLNVSKLLMIATSG